MMENSQESTTIEPVVPNANRFPVSKFSRWMDDKGQLLVVLGFYHGGAPGNLATREALDLLNVHNERVGYVTISTFIRLVTNGELMPWQAPTDRPFF